MAQGGGDEAAVRAEADALAAQQSDGSHVDLHWLLVADAVRVAREHVEGWWRGRSSTGGREEGAHGGGGKDAAGEGFKVVTGRGLHSEGGRARLRPAVLSALHDDGWRVEVEMGYFVVRGRRRKR